MDQNSTCFEAKKLSIGADGKLVEDQNIVVFDVKDRNIINWSWSDDVLDCITYQESKGVFVVYNCVDPKKAEDLFRRYRQ